MKMEHNYRENFSGDSTQFYVCSTCTCGTLLITM